MSSVKFPPDVFNGPLAQNIVLARHLNNLYLLFFSHSSLLKVEVSSPNAESENTLCTNSILGQPVCSNVIASSNVPSDQSYTPTLPLANLQAITTDNSTNDNSGKMSIHPSIQYLSICCYVFFPLN